MKLYNFAILACAITFAALAQDKPGWLQSEPDKAKAIDWLAKQKLNQNTPVGLSVSPTEQIPLSDYDAAASLGKSTNSSLGKQRASRTTSNTGNEADEITTEITALARGLRNDPVKIFEYVHNFIEYEAYFGCKKGAHLTLLEGSGNEYDQSALLVALLRAAGYNPNYVSGPCYFTFEQMASKLALDTAPFSHWTDAQMIAYFYPPASGKTPPAGFPTLVDRQQLAIKLYLTERGYPYVESFTNSGFTWFTVPHVWVEMNGKILSPSYKLVTIKSGINLAAATGYARNTILSDAGGSVSPDGATWVSGLNYTSLSNRLSTYTQNFIQHVRNNYDYRESDEITESVSINKSSFSNLDIQSSTNLYGVRPIFPASVAWMPIETWSAIPTAHMSKLQITAGEWNKLNSTWTTTKFDQSINLPALKGRKLSLTYSGNVGRFRLDETQFGPDVQVANLTEFDVRLSVSHNHYELERVGNTNVYNVIQMGKTNQSEVKKYQIGDDCAYSFIYSFSDPSRLTRARQQILDNYRRAGVSNDNWKLRTETLNILGLTWFQQVYQSGKVISGLYRVNDFNHHAFGRVGQERSFASGAISFYIDVGLVRSGSEHRTSNINESRNFSYLHTTLASAMEHGVLEQMQGTGLGATSTVKMIHLANQSGQRIYRGNSANWNSVTGELIDYSPPNTPLSPELTEIGIALNANPQSKVLLPQSGKQILNQYIGFGYALEEPSKVTMKIGANFGGYNSSPGAVSSSDVWQVLVSDSSYLASTSIVNASTIPHNTPQAVFADPVDVATGAWISDVSDLSLGSTFLNGLAFSRSCNSNASYDQSAGMGYGWTHNHDITATRRSNVEAGLGATTSYQAAPFYAALAAASDLARDHTTAKQWATSALIMHWAVDQLRYKSVAVKAGNKTMEFVQMPNGTFISPAGINHTLTKNGNGSSEYFTLTGRHGSAFKFRTNGKIDTITDQNGNITQYTYDSGRLEKVADAFGHEINLHWTSSRITSVSDNTARSVVYGYTGSDLTSVTDPEGKVMNYLYDTSHRVVEIKDAEGRTTIENEYDDKGRVVIQRNMGLEERTYDFYYSGYCNIEKNPLGGEISHFYDDRLRLIGSENALGHNTAYLYDGQNRKIWQRTPKGEQTDWFYNADNNLEFTIDPRVEITQYFYDSQLRLEEVVDGLGNSSFISYLPNHQIASTMNQLGDVTSYEYHPNGLLYAVTDPENKTTTSVYDIQGNIYKVTAHDSSYQLFTHNARGDREYARDGAERVTTFTYNKRRQLLTTTLPPIVGEPAAVLQLTYDDAGNLHTETDAKGYVTTHTWTATGKIHTTLLPSLPTGNNILVTNYDVRDLPVTVSNSVGHTTTTEYDAAQRVEAVIDPISRRTENVLDANGQVLETKDALNRVNKSSWTSRGELQNTTDGESKSTAFVYDAVGNLTSRSDRRSKLYSFTYDDANRPETTTTPSGKTTTTTYYDNGLVKTIKEASQQMTTISYDGKNLVSTKVDPVGSVAYGYDTSGLLTTVTEGSTTIHRSYDARGRLKSVTTADGDLIQYGYDANNNLTRLTYPDGKIVNYTYNARNLLWTVTDWSGRVTTYTYDAIGRLTNVARPNGTSADYSYDAAGQLLECKEKSYGSALLYLKYKYDDAGQIESRLRAPTVNPSSAYQHPALNLTYDDDNRISTLNGQSVTHDADGNMIYGPISPTSGFTSLVYNSRNQLISANGLTYTYDAEGRRRTVSDATGTTRDVIDPGAALSRLLVRHHANGTKTFYVYGLGLLYEVDQANNTKTYHYDQVGSTVLRTNTGGAIIGRAEYSPYGICVFKEGDMNTPFLYNGKVGIQTDNNGLLHMRARYYSPFLKRFLNVDPLGFGGGSNWFAFANGNPISLSDPFGLCAVDCDSFGWDTAMIFTKNFAHDLVFNDEDLLANMKTGIDYTCAGMAMLIQGVGEVANAPWELTGLDPMALGPCGGAEFGFFRGLSQVGSWSRTAIAARMAPAANSLDELVTVYRGVNSGHANFVTQSAGVVRPNNQWWQFWKGSGSTPFEHNAASGGTLNSPFTSWTTDLRVAENYALRPGGTPGVVIEAQVPASRLVPSPNTKSVGLIQGGGVVSESEVLIRGTVRGTPTARP